MTLAEDEQDAINQAQNDGQGWALPADLSAEVRERLLTKGLARYWGNRWQLTPLGFSYTPTFQRW